MTTMVTKKTGIRKWYVLRTFSGHEKKVKEAIQNELELKGFQRIMAAPIGH